jgi:hypothetical protein
MATGPHLLILIIVVAGCIVLMKLFRRLRARRAAAHSHVASSAAHIPTFRVVALGLQGSGKTLLLTSIYRRMQVPGDRGYYLRTPYEQLIELNRWYQETANTDTDWPRGTSRGEMREFEFSLMTHLDDGPATMFKLGYLEYPGELLTDPEAPGGTAQARLLESVATADALIGIIDGLRVLQTYQGEQRGKVLLQTTLDAMVHTMLSARAPMVFVISKWDLLDQLHPDENVRLEIVRNLLMGVDGFRDLVRVHSARRIIRLVPVTAVGHDFAVLHDGQVRKKPQGHFEPINVEAALSAVVPDILRQVELSLDHATRQAIMAETQRRLRMGPREAVRSLSTFVAERAGRALMAALGGGVLGDAGMALFLDSRTQPVDHTTRLAKLSEADRRAEEFVQARRRVMYALEHQVNMLEATLPASRLWG